MMKMHYRLVDIVIEAFCALLLVSMWLYLLLNWSNFPDVLPTHYGFDGKADAWGGKGSLFFLPGMAVGMYVLLTVCCLFPKLWNMPKGIPAGQEERAYSVVLTSMQLMKLEVLLIFGYLFWCSSHAVNSGIIFLIVSVVILLGTVWGMIWRCKHL